MVKTNGKTTDEFVNMFSFLTKVVRVPTPTLAGFVITIKQQGKTQQSVPKSNVNLQHCYNVKNNL